MPIYTDTTGHNLVIIILVKVVNLSKLLPLPKKVCFFWWTPFNFSLPKLLERFSIWNPQTCSLCVKQKARNSHNPRDGKNLMNGFPFPAGFPWISVSENLPFAGSICIIIYIYYMYNIYSYIYIPSKDMHTVNQLSLKGTLNIRIIYLSPQMECVKQKACMYTSI